MSYNSGVKAIFFGSTATVHSYFWLYTVLERLKKKKNLFCVHTTFPLSMSLCSDFNGFDGGCGCVLVIECNIILL